MHLPRNRPAVRWTCPNDEAVFNLLWLALNGGIADMSRPSQPLRFANLIRVSYAVLSKNYSEME